MTKLYELINEYNAFWDALNDPETDWDAAETLLAQIEGKFDGKLENCAKVVRSMEAEVKGAKEETDRLAGRAKTLESKAKGLKKYMPPRDADGRARKNTDAAFRNRSAEIARLARRKSGRRISHP